MASFVPHLTSLPATLNLLDCPYMAPHCDETLYAVMSHLSGWEPNPLVLLRAHRMLPNGGGVGERCRFPGCGLDAGDLQVWLAGASQAKLVW